MKTNIKVFAFAVFSIAVFSVACAVNQSSLKNGQTIEKQTYTSLGIVRKIDAEGGKITIDHEDIAGYMSAMQMTESVIDKSLLDNIKIGDKVDFEIERTGSKLVITKITKISEIDVLNGSEIYKMNCAECHGGKGEGAKKGIPLISGHALHHSEIEHIKQVTDGEGEKMPAFKDKLSAEQIAEVVKFLRTEFQKSANREESHKHAH